MSKTSKNKKSAWKTGLIWLLFVLIGAVCGFGMVFVLETVMEGADRTLGEELFLLALLCAGICGLLFVQIIIHEAGHLVCGLLSGYRFSSFRIGSLMWVKEQGKVRFRRLKLAGTGGQCLMVPPPMTDGGFPVTLFNLGGPLFNLLSGIVFLGGFFLSGKSGLVGALCLFGASIGFLLGAVNGIPLRSGLVDNDGCNALALSKTPAAMRAFWIQLAVNDQITQGVRLKDMPAEWFAVPADDQMQNSMVAALGVYACNRLMDAHRFADADRLMTHLLSIDSKIAGLHRNLLICDRIFCLIAVQGAIEDAKGLYTKELQAFMKSMEKFPAVLRTQYVYALLVEQDSVKAEAIRMKFETAAKSYPYSNEIDGERELIQVANRQKGVLS